MTRRSIHRFLVLAVTALAGCTLTLPFDSLTEGVKPALPDASTDAPDAAPRPPPPPPTSLYSFEEGSGEIVGDSIGKNPGFIRREVKIPSWTKEGKRGGALDFGSDPSGWVTVPTLSGTNFPKAATVAFWVRARKYSDEGLALFTSFEEDAAEDIFPIGVYVGDTFIVLELLTPPPADAGDIDFPSEEAATTSVPPNTWVLVVAGWDVSTNRAALFVRTDGPELGQFDETPLPDGFTLKKPAFNISAADAVVDEVRYYDHLLSQQEMAAID